VDENGKPMALEAADFPAGGGGGHTMADFETLIDFTTEETVVEFQIPVNTEASEKLKTAADIYIILKVPRDIDNETIETTGSVTIKARATSWDKPIVSNKTIITAPSYTWSTYGELYCHVMRSPTSSTEEHAATLHPVICLGRMHDVYANGRFSEVLNEPNDEWGIGVQKITVTATQNMYKGTRFVLGVRK
jgi:hypothetical protein